MGKYPPNEYYIGKKYNMLTCLEYSHNVYGEGRHFKFSCDCGCEIVASIGKVKNNYVKSCGCLRKVNVRKASFKDLTGQRFNYLTVLEYAGRKGNRTMWKCLCECGNTTFVDSRSLKSGNTKACGCHQSDGWGNSKTHGMSKTKIYRTWMGMKNRCYRKSNKHYGNYGGRGIKVCDEWMNSFELFRDWAFKSGYSEELTLDRIDNDGNYCPENCRWVDRFEQMNNTRSNHRITFNGNTMTLTEWSRKIGLPAHVLRNRINNYGWSEEEALTIPLLKKGDTKEGYLKSVRKDGELSCN